jgi:hypothetical protein
MSASRAKNHPEQLRLVCGCGFKGGATLLHYDVVRCKCGRSYWALRPTRSGPMQFFPWPGKVPLLEEAA